MGRWTVPPPTQRTPMWFTPAKSGTPSKPKRRSRIARSSNGGRRATNMKTTLPRLVAGPLVFAALTGAARAQQMPDVVGIRLGMPVREAYAVLQAQYPKVKPDPYSFNLPTIVPPVLRGFSLGFTQ